MTDDDQPALFPSRLRLVRIDAEKNMRRFYRLALQPDLFGGCALVREWGRLGAGGRVRHDLHASEGEALDALDELRRRKARRGYRAE